MKSYSLFSNIKYIYKEANGICGRMKVWLILNLIASILVPILGSVIASIVVYLLTNNYSIYEYMEVIGIMILITLFLEIIMTYTSIRYNWESTFIRCSAFWNKLSRRGISCDYEKIEAKAGQKALASGFEALDSNWIGIEGTMKETPFLVVNSIGMIVYAVLVAIYCPLVLIPMVLMVSVDLLFGSNANRIVEKNREETNASYYETRYLSNDIANPINGKDIRIYGLHKWFARRFDTLTKNRIKSEKKYHLNTLGSELSHTGFDLFRDLLSYLTLVALVLNGSLDTSTFVFMIGICFGFSTWTSGFSLSFYRLKSDSVQVSCYRRFLSETEKKKEDNKIDINSIAKPLSVEFKNVSFTYPDTDSEIIHDLSFKIEKGEKIALVGNNGAGKTTIIKLMCGLYTPTSGSVLVNDIDIKNFDRDEYATLISAVFQDSKEFAFTILDNICCVPSDKVDYQLFDDCITKAGIKEKIESLPEKENTYLTQNFKSDGILLSGGETQRLMLARALYKNSPLLLLDEPTAALDPLNEEKMYMLYQSFSENNTSVFISHRLASTRFCNRIFFLENGKIVETGTHDELLKLNKKYREMFDIQAQYYKEEKSDEERI